MPFQGRVRVMIWGENEGPNAGTGAAGPCPHPARCLGDCCQGDPRQNGGGLSGFWGISRVKCLVSY